MGGALVRVSQKLGLQHRRGELDERLFDLFAGDFDFGHLRDLVRRDDVAVAQVRVDHLRIQLEPLEHPEAEPQEDGVGPAERDELVRVPLAVGDEAVLHQLRVSVGGATWARIASCFVLWTCWKKSA